MTNPPVIRFAVTCEACKQALHDRCWEHLGELFGYPYRPCKCDCYDENDELTHAALVEMARRQPEALARKIRFDTAFAARSSLDLHMREARTGTIGTLREDR